MQIRKQENDFLVYMENTNEVDCMVNTVNTINPLPYEGGYLGLIKGEYKELIRELPVTLDKEVEDALYSNPKEGKWDEYEARLQEITNAKFDDEQIRFICNSVGRRRVLTIMPDGIPEIESVIAWLALNSNGNAIICVPSTLHSLWVQTLKLFFKSYRTIYDMKSNEAYLDPTAIVVCTSKYLPRNYKRTDWDTLIVQDGKSLMSERSTLRRFIASVRDDCNVNNIAFITQSVIKKNIIKSYAILSLLGLHITREAFIDRFAIEKFSQFRDRCTSRIIGYKNLDLLFSEISRKICWFHSKKSKKPKFIPVPIEPDITFEEKYRYLPMRNPFAALENQATQNLRRAQLCGGFVDGMYFGTPKMSALKNLILTQTRELGKTIVWCRFTNEMEYIRGFLAENTSLHPPVITGDTPDHVKEKYIERGFPVYIVQEKCEMNMEAASHIIFSASQCPEIYSGIVYMLCIRGTIDMEYHEIIKNSETFF